MNEFNVGWIIPINYQNFFGKVLDNIKNNNITYDVSITTMDCIAQILDELSELRRERFNETCISRSQLFADKINKIEGLATQSPI